MKNIIILSFILFSFNTLYSQSLNDEFMELMQDGKASIEDIDKYIEQGADVNYIYRQKGKWYSGMSPIHMAAVYQKLDWFKLFERNGADIHRFTLTEKDIPGSYLNNPNYSALHLAAYYYYDGSTAMLDYLLSKGFDINAYCDNGYTILHVVLISDYTKHDIVKYLVEHGADVNKSHKLGETGALFWTFANESRYEDAEYLVKHGAKTEMKGYSLNSNLIGAAVYRNVSKFSILFFENGLFDIDEETSIYTYENNTRHSYLALAVDYNDYKLVKYILEKSNNAGVNSKAGKEAMKIAVEKNDKVMIQLLKTKTLPENFQKWLDITDQEEYRSVDFQFQTDKLEFTAKDIYGNTVRGSDFEGKIVFMNYWATWCGFCLKEFPSMQKLWEIIGKNNMVILAITNEDAEEYDNIKEYANSKDYEFIYIHDPENKIGKKFGVGTLPGTRLFDKKGFSVATIDGSRTWDKDLYVKMMKLLSNKDNNNGNTNTEEKVTANKWIGHWEIKWSDNTPYNMYLVSTNLGIQGNYNYKNGQITGSSKNEYGKDILDGQWTQSNNSGWFKFIMSPDGKSFKGSWGYKGSNNIEGSWSGTKK